MADETASSQFISFDGVATASRAPSSIPMLVVPDSVLAATAGPVPVTVEHAGRSVPAWAWAERAWDGRGAETEEAARPSALTFSLSRLTSQALGITDLLADERCDVTVHVPVPAALAPVMPLVHDLPSSDEIQVPSDFPRPEGRAVMIRHGVAASVVVVRRDHVRSGTARISNHLRGITEPAGGTRDDDSRVVLLYPDRPPRTWSTADVGAGRRPGRIAVILTALHAWTERALRWFFRAEEQAMRVVVAHPYDEHQHVVNVTEGALTRLGVSSGDKVVLHWLGQDTEITVLQDPAAAGDDAMGPAHAPAGRHDPTRPGLAAGMSPHLAVRVPTALRYVMGLPAASVVTVRRSTRSVLARNLNNLIVPVASLALAGAALNDPNWPLLVVGAVVTALLGLSRLRMGTRRATPMGRSGTRA